MVKELYPFNNNYLDLNSNRYHYVDEGQGDPVVMLHGNPTWSFYYRNLILALKDNHRTIVPDHMGCGLSDKPESYNYTFDQRAKDVEALLDHLDIKKNITLVVHDWGGMIGMLFATRFPERIKRIVVFNTAAFHLPNSKMFPWALRICRNTRFGAYIVRRFNAFCRIAARVCVKVKPLSPEIKEAYLKPYDSWENRVAILRFVQDIPLVKKDPGYDLITEIQDKLKLFSETPILICWGKKDFVFSYHFLEEWIRYCPHAEVHRFPKSGHYILEDSHVKIIPLLKDFLNNNPIEEKK